MTKRTIHLCAAALALLVTVPAVSHGQEAKNQRRPVSDSGAAAPVASTAAGKRPVSARPKASLGPASKRDVVVETRRTPARKSDPAERFRQRRRQR